MWVATGGEGMGFWAKQWHDMTCFDMMTLAAVFRFAQGSEVGEAGLWEVRRQAEVQVWGYGNNSDQGKTCGGVEK